jgi:hypothetical protein
MRKIVSLLLTLLLFISMRTAATAATITAVPGSDSMDVMATYEPGGTSEIIYSVDISWGSMEFTYTSATEGTWDPETHTYGGSSQGTWSCDNDANKSLLQIIPILLLQHYLFMRLRKAMMKSPVHLI